MEKENVMDYGKTYNDLPANLTGDYWKPSQGKHAFEILSEAEECEYTDKEGNVTPQIKFKVMVKDKEMVWAIPKGKTRNSIYGHIMALGTKNKNKLKGIKSEVLVTGEEKQKRYVIPEVLDMIAEEQERS